jgi:Trp operon repressor
MYFTDHLTSVANFLSAIKTGDMSAVLEDIMTPQEIVELGERLQLLKKLKS